jgi:hypothetical protein
MLKDLMDSDEANIGGIFSLVATGMIKVYEWITLEQVNDWLQLFLALGGAFFLFHRIKGQMLDNKIKKRELDK